MSDLKPVRFSSLKYMSRSPAHYLHALNNPPAQSKPMRLGSAVDALLFGTQKVAVSECATRRGKVWDSFVNENPGAVLLTPGENDVVVGMWRSVLKNEHAVRLLKGGTAQQRIEWSMAGRSCAGTPDVVGVAGYSLVDLKTTRNSKPEFFQYDARKMAYHAQIEWYMNGLELSGHKRPKKAFIVAVENVAPYVVTIFELTERALLEGRKLWTVWFERLRVCEASGVWPGYCEAAVPLDTPDSEALTLQIEGEDVEV